MTTLNRIPEGQYDATVVHAEYTQIGKKGTPAVLVRLRVGDADEVEYLGWLSPNAEQYTVKALALLGWRGDLDDVQDMVREGQQGRRVNITVRNEERDGVATGYTKVRFVNEPRRKYSGPVRADVKANAKAAFARAQAERLDAQRVNHDAAVGPGEQRAYDPLDDSLPF